MDYSNTTSEERCWLGDTVVPLPDLNTEDPTVVAGFSNWIQSLVKEYNIDGLRIDGKRAQTILSQYNKDFVSCEVRLLLFSPLMLTEA
jgi:hypothetical protein